MLDIRGLLRGGLFACLALALAPPSSATVAEEEIVPPRPRAHVPVPYPSEGRGEAQVRLSLVVGASGNIEELRVVEVKGEPAAAFREAAIAWIAGLRFEPALRAGEPVAVELEYEVRFLPPASADELPPAEEAEPPVEEKGDYESIVRSRRPPPPPSSASETRIDPARYSAIPRRNAEQLLTLAPGILLRNHQGEGHASAVFLRGFDAGEGQDLQFTMDGVPLNEVSNPHGHGYADTHFLLPELVRELRVVEGPFDVRQGDFAVAGSVEYRLGLPARGLKLQVGQGNYDAQELLLLWGPEEQEEGTFVAARLRRGDGFGRNRAHGAASGMAGLERRVGDRGRLRLVLQSHAGRFDSAGVIRQDDLEAGRLPCGGGDAGFFCSYDSNQGGSGSRHGIHAAFERRTDRSEQQGVVYAVRRRLRLRENFTGWYFDEQGRGDGSEASYEALTLGTKGSLAIHRELLGRRQRLEFGYEARHDDGSAILRRLRGGSGEPWTRVFDHELRVTHVGAHGGARLQLLKRLRLEGGLRVDAFHFDVVAHDRPTETRNGPREPDESIDADGFALSPRATLGLRLLEGLEWITAYGEGVRSTDAAALSQGEFAPFARVHALESGLVLAGEAPFDAGLRLVGFATHVDRDLVFDERQSRNVFAGASNRHGAQLSASASIAGFDGRGSLTWAEAHLAPPGASPFALGEGPRLPYVPRWVGRLDLALRGELLPQLYASRGRIGVGLTWVGARPLPNEQFGEPYATVDVGAKLSAGLFEFGLSAENLLDARYHQAEFHYASNFGGSGAPASRFGALHFAAGPPRLLFFTLALILDEEEKAPSGVGP